MSSALGVKMGIRLGVRQNGPLIASGAIRSMGWNLVWYVPLAAVMLLGIARQNAELLWEGLVATYRHFSVMLFVSLAFYLWIEVLFLLPLIPVYALVFVFEFISTRRTGSYRHPYLASAGTVVAAVAACELLVFLAAQSWPFLADPQRYERIRVFPFVTCPGCYPIR